MENLAFAAASKPELGVGNNKFASYFCESNCFVVECLKVTNM